jgi:hypothetical protein
MGGDKVAPPGKNQVKTAGSGKTYTGKPSASGGVTGVSKPGVGGIKTIGGGKGGEEVKHLEE